MLPQVLEQKTGETLYYINDSHNEIRWIFTPNQVNPVFLNLYNTNSLKGLLYKSIIKAAFRINLRQQVVSGSLNFSLNEKYQNHLKKLNCTGFSIFTGTPGENRKIIMEFNDDHETKYFIKIPSGKKSFDLINNEKLFLKEIALLKLTSVKIPSIIFHDQHCVIMTNVKPKKHQTKNILGRMHKQFIIEIFEKTKQEILFENWSFWKEIKRNSILVFWEEKSNFDHRTLQSFSEKIETLIKRYESETELLVSLAHGDFTPWNLYVTKNSLHLYDLEMARKDAPLFFDLFHFIFQTEILIGKRSYAVIRKKLINIFKESEMKEIVDRYNIDYKKYYSLYLLYIVTYYLPKYANQQDLHLQAWWLKDVWKEALNDLANNNE